MDDQPLTPTISFRASLRKCFFYNSACCRKTKRRNPLGHTTTAKCIKSQTVSKWTARPNAWLAWLAWPAWGQLGLRGWWAGLAWLAWLSWPGLPWLGPGWPGWPGLAGLVSGLAWLAWMVGLCRSAGDAKAPIQDLLNKKYYLVKKEIIFTKKRIII